MLLAVDLGLNAGLASFDTSGRLRWARSTRFGTKTRLKKAIPSLLAPEIEVMVSEGDAGLRAQWERVAKPKGIQLLSVTPEIWRKRLLLSREQRTGAGAKKVAQVLALRLFDDANLPRPPSLRHDAAEAILIGLWAVYELGWRKDVPVGLQLLTAGLK